MAPADAPILAREDNARTKNDGLGSYERAATRSAACAP